jgi:hypothetical protein
MSDQQTPQGSPIDPNPQPQYQQPQPPPQGQYQAPPQYAAPGDGAATGSLVCGIIGLVLGNIILGIIAIVQGNKALRQGFPGGKAKAGKILGIIDIAWSIVVIVLYVVLIGFAGSVGALGY